MKSFLFATGLCLNALLSHAQLIQPQDLYSVNSVWQSDAVDADREAYKAIKLIDNNWSLTGKPTSDSNGFLAIYGFTKDHKQWYKSGTCVLILMVDPSKPLHKTLIYQFTEKSTWDMYRNQIDAMHPTVFGAGPHDGGNNIAYKVNGLIIGLTDYPPGIKDEERTYQVQIWKDK